LKTQLVEILSNILNMIK